MEIINSIIAACLPVMAVISLASIPAGIIGGIVLEFERKKYLEERHVRMTSMNKK